nr:auxin response factor 4-like [Tanacetum cinerariifolium]
PRTAPNMHQRLNNPSFYPLGSEGGRNFFFQNPAPVIPTIVFPINRAGFENGVTRNDINGLQIQLQPRPHIDLGNIATSDPVVQGNSGSEKDDGGSDSNGSSCKLFGFQLNEAHPIVDAQSLSKRSCIKGWVEENCKILIFFLLLDIYVINVRAIDLSKMSNYDELFRELESLFHMEGILSNHDGAWRLLYTDEENDMMVVGDDPWDEFA